MPKSKRRKRSKSKSGYIGAYKNTRGNKYSAQIAIDGKIKYLGSSYGTAKQAAKAYDTEAIKLRRPFSKLNYPKAVPVGYTPIQQALRSNNTVGYRGVYKKRKKFRADIWIGGKQTHLGTYDIAKEAAIAYDRAVLQANQSKTLLNFPGMVHNLDIEQKRKKQKIRSKVGYKGLVKLKSGRYNARIRTDGKQKNIGTFDTAITAAHAYDQAAIEAGRKQHQLNFPDDYIFLKNNSSEFKNYRVTIGSKSK